MDYNFELATPADDPAIRRLLATNPVPGQVTLAYEREPNYFRGCATMGPFYQIGVARHRPDGAVVGLGCRASRPLWINGELEEVGYLGQLRVDEQFRGRWLVPLGFRFLHQLHADGRVTGYITTIIEGNTVAQGVLVERARGYLPAYREIDRLCTASIILRAGRRPATLPSTSSQEAPPQVRRPQGGQATGSAAYTISPGSAADVAAIVAFLRQYGAAKQFFPAYSEQDFCGNPVTLGFRVEDFILAYRQQRLVGLVGLWDQSSYKQTVVRAYRGSLRWLRPAYNLAAPLGGWQPLPAPGQAISFAYASFICVAGNDPDIFAGLLDHVYTLAAGRGYAYLMVGLSCRDPLLAVVRRYAHIPYYSRLYTVCWPDGDKFHEKLDNRIPYVEIAAL